MSTLEYFMSSLIQSFIFRRRFDSILKTFPSFFQKDLSFKGVEPQEGSENVPCIMTRIFLQLVSAPLNRMHRKAEIDQNLPIKRENRGANLLISGE